MTALTIGTLDVDAKLGKHIKTCPYQSTVMSFLRHITPQTKSTGFKNRWNCQTPMSVSSRRSFSGIQLHTKYNGLATKFSYLRKLSSSLTLFRVTFYIWWNFFLLWSQNCTENFQYITYLNYQNYIFIIMHQILSCIFFKCKLLANNPFENLEKWNQIIFNKNSFFK